ncbi:hypothetical protein [Neoaquamicrobium sediminum]|uniref:hypothetical protein n=1 Tax=Neoaquamicrobium sediminum TaxID=1849104 RepID=UPI00406BCA60
MTSHDIEAALGAFHRAIAEETGPQKPWQALQALAQQIVGAKLFTVTTVDLDAEVARRLYTNMPEAYPVSGTKPITVDPWFQQVVIGKQLFVANTLEAIAGHFLRLGADRLDRLPLLHQHAGLRARQGAGYRQHARCRGSLHARPRGAGRAFADTGNRRVPGGAITSPTSSQAGLCA